MDIERKIVERLTALASHYKEIKEGDAFIGSQIEEKIKGILSKDVADVSKEEIVDLYYQSSITPFIQSEFVKIVCCIMELYIIASEGNLVGRISEEDRKLIIDLVKYADGYFMLKKEGESLGFKSDVIKEAVMERSRDQFDGDIQSFYNSLKENYEQIKGKKDGK